MNRIALHITVLFLFLASSLYAQKDRSDSVVIRYMQQKQIPISSNNECELLIDGRAKFSDLFQQIRHARHHIHLEYFNFRNDSLANALFDLLAEKAAEGVKVRAMFDAFGNWSNNKPLKKKHVKSLRARGIEIVKFDPILFPYLNHAMHRDHRKIVVIDGKIGYTGGMNIADYYIHGNRKVGNWRDVHLRIEGEAAQHLQAIFAKMWKKETGEVIEGKEYFPDIPAEEGQTVAIVDRTPRKTPRSISHAYAASIDAAQNSIQIVNPYFLPTNSIRNAIKRALQRGVAVEIMIPAVSDIPFTPEASYHAVHQLMKEGANIYLYNGGFHHSKIMMVDRSFCTVGTANLNSRSLRYDYETNAFVFDAAITQQLTRTFEQDKKNCTLLTPDVWAKRSAWKKGVGKVGYLLTPFL